MFPFALFANVDTILGPEMKSTGEVMGIDKSFEMAFLKAQLAVGNKVVTKGNVLISVKDSDKNESLLQIVRALEKFGFGIYATQGSADFLSKNKIKVTSFNKEQQGGYTVIDLIKAKKVDYVITTTLGTESVANSLGMRRAALMNRVFYLTTIAAAKCLVGSITKLNSDKDFEVFSLQNL